MTEEEFLEELQGLAFYIGERLESELAPEDVYVNINVEVVVANPKVALATTGRQVSDFDDVDDFASAIQDSFGYRDTLADFGLEATGDFELQD